MAVLDGDRAATSRRVARWRLRAVLLAASGVMGACGGGVFIGFGDGFDDSPPSVTLATAAVSVSAGQSARFVAAAADENGVDRVDFYRVDAGGAARLGSDSSSPYEWDVVAPADGRVSLSVFARATDNHGNRADSAIVSIPVTP